MYIKLTGICNLQHVAECDQMQVLPTFKGLISTEPQSAQSFAGLRRRNLWKTENCITLPPASLRRSTFLTSVIVKTSKHE